jgi:hypothetical protein
VIKPLLTILLAVVQLTAWGRAPLYLCVSSNGTVCVDLGPDFCDCCQHEDANHACASACIHHDHAAINSACVGHECPAVDDSLVAEPCDCTHIGLSSGQDAAMARADLDRDQDVGLLAALPLCLSNACVTEANSFAARPFGYSPSIPCSLALLATVVMRY